MRAEKVVSFLLNDDSTIASIVDEKIYGGVALKGTAAPMLVYAKQSASRSVDLSAEAAVVTALIDVLVVARTYQELKALSEAVRLAVAYKYGEIAGVENVETQINDEGPDEYDPDLNEFAQVWTFNVVHVE